MQGESLEELEELKENLRALYRDLASGEVLCVRRVDELEVAWRGTISSRSWKTWGACWCSMAVSIN